ncbi:hypothetical protein EST38_g9033 [Candolleomyces aberdarensis]|uniref:Uncharacterized protein n=1 Tax=Candolleomyces aberdarensis TaxID=2316362 RepID=A0A4Q2DD97_9AGAR|nr:hypothetical protein EST38_g9033 [Candolleomyces aberdarensis]
MASALTANSEDLRMHHDRKKWNAELAKWRCVIQLKLIQSVIIILDALQAEGRDQWLNECPDAAPKEAIGPTAMNEPVVILPRPDIAPGPKSGIESDRQRVLLRLAPLRRVEQNLHKWLSASAEETAHPAGEKEWDREHEDALMMISMCREDIRAVWTNEKVQVSLREGKIHLEESAEFFLEEVDRVASRNYIPSDEDVARVRSRPVVQEYWINLQRRVDCPPNYNTGWCLYDISRPRRSRDVWIPYVEGLCAIMFFVDLSGFNSRLSDGSKVTQLEDSVILWRTICESPILQKAGLILFLTRGDLLKHKLESGIQVKDYVPSYGDRPNDVGAVVEYFKHHFKAIANRRATDKRSPLFVFTTSNVDVRTMETAIRAASEMMNPGDDDPFAIFLRPPKSESNAERVAREIREAEAKKRSEDIDQEFVAERERLMRAEELQTRVALLGGSESGKSEMIKYLRMHHGREEWNAELAKWRCAIQLKLVQSVMMILDALEAEGRGEQITSIEELRQLVLRLAPLKSVEQNLHTWVRASAEDITHAAGSAQWQKEHEDATMMIAMCREDIKTVWMNEKVQSLLREGKIHFGDSENFLFEAVDRITSRDYTPSDEDVAHVRSRPVVQECRIKFQQPFGSPGGFSETELRLYDIATQRMAKDAWIPYFEGLRAIMFFVGKHTRAP